MSATQPMPEKIVKSKFDELTSHLDDKLQLIDIIVDTTIPSNELLNIYIHANKNLDNTHLMAISFFEAGNQHNVQKMY
jgi:hypothetical protein